MSILRIGLLFLLTPAPLLAQSGSPQVAPPCTSVPAVVQARLIAPGSTPFHLKATITDKDDPSHPGSVEMFWVAPDKWRREIKGPEFTQTLVVNGKKVFEQDSEDYFPLALQTLVTAIVDPTPILAMMRPGDRMETKANCVADESGMVCFGPVQPGSQNRICMKSPLGLRETVAPPGHHVEFATYQEFEGKRVARMLTTSLEVGSWLRANVTELVALKDPDPKLFEIREPTPRDHQIRIVTLSESEIRSLLSEDRQVIWPQVLDGKTLGTASYYVSIDRAGRVRETVVVQSDNERANDSARAQIETWKFKPLRTDGTPAQIEGTLNFTLNTSAFGPASVLTDADARKLATNVVEPAFPPDSAPAGSIYTLMVAVDANGKIIEVIPGGGPPGLYRYCSDALGKWHFSPIMENGQPRPYRAQIDFRVP